ncbi:MAG: saccharopine dehydrogenase, partial [Actinomycetia bacterium]|nr:saccharopine dehydrogenase [Actinomycetes bacterium]
RADLRVAQAEAGMDGHENGKAIELVLSASKAGSKLVSEPDLTISLAPPPFHPIIARHCLDHEKPMVTASYVSDEMKALDQEARDKGVTLLNEIGVDPGIDHMSAMRVIDAVHDKGGKILAFRSYCGGLPAPECNDNPFGYKVSWAPRGVLMASRSDAYYLKAGIHVNTPN